MASSFTETLRQPQPGTYEIFWTLFDILWAVEGAFIQYCAVGGQRDHSEEDAGMQWRMKVLETAYSLEYTLPHQLGYTMSALCSTLLHWSEKSCECHELAKSERSFQVC